MKAWERCSCGHLGLAHDINEYDGDGSDLCCVVGCSQVGCPGKAPADAGGTPE